MTVIKESIDGNPFTYRTIWNTEFIYIVSLIVFVFCILFVIIRYYTYNHRKRYDKINNEKPPGSKIRDEITCKKNNGTYINGKCICNPPYTGDMCQNQLYDKKYTYINANFDTISSPITRYLSFGDNSCTSLCDKNTDCEGVSFNNNICTLIKNITPNKKGNKILSKTTNYNFKSAFLFRSNKLPDMFWNNNLEVKDGDTITLSFVPTSYYISSGTLTFYSTPDKSDHVIFKTTGFNLLQNITNKKYVTFNL